MGTSSKLIYYNNLSYLLKATDEEGRRRFHGAFTGGFSAGYFNTVGSEEGWTPRTFVSSRTKRADKKHQNVRDIMDEEDISDELSTAMKAKAEYDSIGSTANELAKRKKQNISTKTAFGALLDDLVVPAPDTVGVRLLKKMGWREGHGIGPKRKKIKLSTPQQDLSSNSKRIMGPAIPAELRPLKSDTPMEEDNDTDEFTANMLFAPRDVQTVEYEVKDNFYGIGYDPYTTAPEFRGEKEKKVTDTSDVVTMVSVLGKGPSAGGKFGLGAFEDADDFDPYSNDNIENYDNILLGEREAALAKKLAAKKAVKEQEPEPEYAIDTKKCSDGSVPLRGFRISTRPLEKPKMWAPPLLPPNYKPAHQMLPDQQVHNTFTPTNNLAANAQQRGKLLGETPLPTTQKKDSTPANSVFDLLSPEDKTRLGTRFTSGPTETQVPPAGLTEWEINRHDKIFQETANKFKPLHDMMSQRFVRGTTQIGDRTLSADKAKQQQEHKVDEYQETAAAMKMYGKLTRKVEEWFPSGLLCKRFNLRNPHAGKKKIEKKSTATEQLIAAIEFPTLPDAKPEEQQQEVQTNAPMESYVPSQEEAEEDTEELPPIEKPSIDIFKAIFENEEDNDAMEKAKFYEAPPPTPAVEVQPSSDTATTEMHTVPLSPLKADETIISVDPATLESIFPSTDVVPIPTKVEEPLPKNEPAANPYIFYPPKQETRGGPAPTTSERANRDAGERKQRQYLEYFLVQDLLCKKVL